MSELLKAHEFHHPRLAIGRVQVRSMAWEGISEEEYQLQFRVGNPEHFPWILRFTISTLPQMFADDFLHGRRQPLSDKHNKDPSYLAVCFAKAKTNSLGINGSWDLKNPSQTPHHETRPLYSVFALQPERLLVVVFY